MVALEHLGLPVVTKEVVEVVVDVVAAEDQGGVDGGDGEAAEPENVQVNVEDEDGPVVVRARGAGVSADEPDGDDDGAGALKRFVSYFETGEGKRKQRGERRTAQICT